MARYGMVIDLNACTGCMACVAACAMENQTPYWNEKYRTHVEDITSGSFPNVKRVLLPRLCMHCENPPCVEVCPTGASFKAEGGFVLVDQKKCIECGYCVISCPFDARYLYTEDDIKQAKSIYGSDVEHVVPHIDKCTFCMHRVKERREPACVETCPTQARMFGDLDDPNSPVAALVRSGKAKPISCSDTKPKVFYVTKEKVGEVSQDLHVNQKAPALSKLWQNVGQRIGSAVLGLATAALIPTYFIARIRERAAEKERALKGEKIRLVPRFSKPRRVFHWLFALSFFILLFSGLVLFIPSTSKWAVGGWSRTLHRIGAVMFLIVPFLYMIFDWKDFKELMKICFSPWTKEEIGFFKHFIGYVFGKPGDIPPQGHVNAGQKLHHLLTVIFYILISASGLALWIGKPHFGQSVSYNNFFLICILVHVASMLILTLLTLGHIYFSILYGGLPGMIDGYVTEEYAAMEHPLWLEEMKREGKIIEVSKEDLERQCTWWKRILNACWKGR